MVWGKGYTELLELLSKHHQSGEQTVHMDCYGTGEDLEAVSGGVLVRVAAMASRAVDGRSCDSVGKGGGANARSLLSELRLIPVAGLHAAEMEFVCCCQG